MAAALMMVRESSTVMTPFSRGRGDSRYVYIYIYIHVYIYIYIYTYPHTQQPPIAPTGLNSTRGSEVVARPEAGPFATAATRFEISPAHFASKPRARIDRARGTCSAFSSPEARGVRKNERVLAVGFLSAPEL